MTSTALSRRTLLGVAFGFALPKFPTAEAAMFRETSGLSAGAFVWQPRLAASGPVLILVSPNEQTLNVYRGTERIGIARCRVSRHGWLLPIGVFALQDQGRRAAAHGEAGSRRAWRATATHAIGLQRAAAALPIRLPRDFAELLQPATVPGATILIAQHRTVPTLVAHGLDASRAEISQIARRAARGVETADAMGEETHVVISAAQRTATLVRAGSVTGTVAIDVSEPHRPLGTHLLTLVGPSADGNALTWLAVSTGEQRTVAALSENAAATALRRISFPDPAAAAWVRAALGSRSALVITDAATSAGTRLAAPGLELFSDSEPAVATGAATRSARKTHVARRVLSRTAEGSEPDSGPTSGFGPLY